MTSVTKASTTASLDLSGIVDGQPADAVTVTTPLNQAATAVDRARSKVSVTAADTHIKELNDALTVGSGITKSVVNPAGDENLQLMIDTAIVATLTGVQVLTNKTLTTPTIVATGFTNMNHAHTAANSGGTLSAAVIASGLLALARGGTNADLSAAGGTGFVLKQSSVGAAITSAALLAAEIPDLAASKITSGALALARGGTNADLSAAGGTGFVLKQSSGGAAITSAALLAADIPSLAASKITSGQLALARGGTNADLSAAGGTGFVLKQSSGGAAITSAALLAADIPSLDAAKITSGAMALARGGTNADLSAQGGPGFVLKQSSAAAPITSAPLLDTDIPTIPNSKISDRAMTEHIAFTQLGGVAGTITLPAIPGGYDHIQLWLGLRSTDAGSTDGVIIRFNGDATAANYLSISSGVSHSATVGTNEFLAGATTGLQATGNIAAAASAAGYYSFAVVNIYNYLGTGSQNRLVTSQAFRVRNTALTGQLAILTGGGMWLNTANAITSITLVTSSGSNFAAGSGYALYLIG